MRALTEYEIARARMMWANRSNTYDIAKSLGVQESIVFNGRSYFIPKPYHSVESMGGGGEAA